MTTDTTSTVERLKAALEKATPGPWHWNSYSAIMPTGNTPDGPEPVAWVPVRIGDLATRQGEADAVLIAEAVNALPRLLAVVRAAQAIVAVHDRTHGESCDCDIANAITEYEDALAALDTEGE